MAMQIKDIRKAAEEKGLKIEWIERGDFNTDNPNGKTYEDGRKIANARFSYKPAAIAYCEDSDAVAGLFKIFKDDPPKFRVRSGGHQHEGMCSADDVLLIDLSRLRCISFRHGRKEAWIGPGCSLRDVYRALWDDKEMKQTDRRLFPGGGCSSVFAGGLVQGGGWGVWLRRYGLSCDNLLEVEIVLADGTKVQADELRRKDLFWAVRGGGGGNFGVVTKFRVRLHPYPKQMTRFRLRWAPEHRLDIARTWMRLQGKAPDTQKLYTPSELTTFCRLSVVPSSSSADPKQDPRSNSVIVAGMFLGSEAKLRKILQPFYDIAQPIPPSKPDAREYTPIYPSPADVRGQQGSQGLTSEMDELIALLQPGFFLHQGSAQGVLAAEESPWPPESTCSTKNRYPHKVSSAFPTGPAAYDQLAKDLIDTLEKTESDPEANLYVSLHGFGGAVADKKSSETAFPYRDKEFMLQFQAWWASPQSSKSKQYIRWIEDFRKHLKGIEGAFINFPDVSLVADPDAQRVELLEHYYAGNLPELRRIKRDVDPKNLFSFGMSIPPAES